MYDRVQQLQHQPTFKVHKSIVNGAMKPADKVCGISLNIHSCLILYVHVG